MNHPLCRYCDRPIRPGDVISRDPFADGEALTFVHAACSSEAVWRREQEARAKQSALNRAAPALLREAEALLAALDAEDCGCVCQMEPVMLSLIDAALCPACRLRAACKQAREVV